MGAALILSFLNALMPIPAHDCPPPCSPSPQAPHSGSQGSQPLELLAAGSAIQMALGDAFFNKGNKKELSEEVCEQSREKQRDGEAAAENNCMGNQRKAPQWKRF